MGRGIKTGPNKTQTPRGILGLAQRPDGIAAQFSVSGRWKMFAKGIRHAKLTDFGNIIRFDTGGFVRELFRRLPA